MKTERKYKVAGVEKGFENKPFGRQIESLEIIRKFRSAAKKGYASTKGGKSSLKAVNEWLKLYKPKEYYAQWREDSTYKDDSIEISYTD